MNESLKNASDGVCQGRSALAGVLGRIRDMDSHEHTPARRWVEDFGTSAQGYEDLVEGQPPDAHNSYNSFVLDEGPVDPGRLKEYWRLGAAAPGRGREVLGQERGVAHACLTAANPKLSGD